MNKVIGLLIYIASFSVAAEESREAQIERYVQGNYFLVGKRLDSKATYYGEVSITKNDSGLSVVRTISGKVVKGSAAVEHATPDKVPVLRIRFSDGGNDYEETCMVGSDLDNYARITCHLYVPGKKTLEPGMEAYFINFNKPF